MLSLAAWISLAVVVVICFVRVMKVKEATDDLFARLGAGASMDDIQAMSERMKAEKPYGPIFSQFVLLAALGVSIANWYTNGVYAPCVLICLAYVASIIGGVAVAMVSGLRSLPGGPLGGSTGSGPSSGSVTRIESVAPTGTDTPVTLNAPTGTDTPTALNAPTGSDTPTGSNASTTDTPDAK